MTQRSNCLVANDPGLLGSEGIVRGDGHLTPLDVKRILWFGDVTRTRNLPVDTLAESVHARVDRRAYVIRVGCLKMFVGYFVMHVPIGHDQL